MNWWKNLRGKIRFREPLRNRTTFKIGGAARFFVQPLDLADLKLVITAAKRYKIPVFVLGAGSNILISDKGAKGIIIQLSSLAFKNISFNKNHAEVGSGIMLRQLIQAAVKNNFSGVEFLAGIPGTVGGALAMNAGAWGKNIGGLVEKVTVMDYNGDVRKLTKKEIKFAYRSSGLSEYIIISALIKLVKKDKKLIERKIKKYLNHRHNTQYASLPNAGCIFKNASFEPAGRLIDLCGLKGRRVGGACISLRHANFILNRGNAKANDVLRLMGLIKKEVKDKFNISLEPEIKIWK